MTRFAFGVVLWLPLAACRPSGPASGRTDIPDSSAHTDSGLDSGADSDTDHPADTADSLDSGDSGETGDSGATTEPLRFTVGDASAELVGDGSWASYGWVEDVAVASAGDVNADGFADVIVGLDGTGEGGAAYLVYGPVSGTHNLADADAVLVGGDGSGMGEAVSGAGDVNGDGFDDVAVGAPWALATMEGYDGTPDGATYLWYGPVSGSRGPETADAVIVGPPGQTYFYGTGVSVAGDGDMDGDGFGDVLVTSTGWNEAWLVRGPIYGSIDPEADAYARFIAVAPDSETDVQYGGDLDGDGLTDVLVGADEYVDGLHRLATLVFLGPDGGDRYLGDEDARLTGALGAPLPSPSGDVDGDGSDDLVVADYSDDHSSPGAAYMVRGPVRGAIDLATAADATVVGDPSDGTIIFASGAGDVDGDGRSDVIVSAAVEWPLGGGVAYLLLGPWVGTRDAASADASVAGAGDDKLGFYLAGAGDMDGDGLDDIVLGAPGNDDGGTDAGAAFIFTGAQLSP